MDTCQNRQPEGSNMNVAKFVVIASLAFAGNASAGWTNMSDAWCSKHGFNKPCEVYLPKAVTQAGGDGDARPREGDIKGTPLRYERPSAEELKLIYDRGFASNLSHRTAAPAPAPAKDESKAKDDSKKTP